MLLTTHHLLVPRS